MGAVSRTSMRLRRLRRRFGIGAPRVAIRTQVAWYWKMLQGAVVVAAVAMLLLWNVGVYFPGRNADIEIRSLRNQVAELGAELSRLRTEAIAGESSIRLERATLKDLSSQIQALEGENAMLREDLAFFEGVLPSSNSPDGVGVRIDRLKVERGARDGEYRYKMLVINNGAKAGEFKGRFELLVRARQNGAEKRISVPDESYSELERFRLEVKGFRRVEGVFEVPRGVEVVSVEARLIEGSSVRSRQLTVL